MSTREQPNSDNVIQYLVVSNSSGLGQQDLNAQGRSQRLKVSYECVDALSGDVAA